MAWASFQLQSKSVCTCKASILFVHCNSYLQYEIYIYIFGGLSNPEELQFSCVFFSLPDRFLVPWVFKCADGVDLGGWGVGASWTLMLRLNQEKTHVSLESCTPYLSIRAEWGLGRCWWRRRRRQRGGWCIYVYICTISMFENIDKYIVYRIQIYTCVFGVNGSAVAWSLGCLAGSLDGWMACAFKSICTLLTNNYVLNCLHPTTSNCSLLQSAECCKCSCLYNDTLDAISKVSLCVRLSGCRHEVQPSWPFTNSAKEIVPAATKQFVRWVNFRRYFCSAFIVHACAWQHICL